MQEEVAKNDRLGYYRKKGCAEGFEEAERIFNQTFNQTIAPLLACEVAQGETVEKLKKNFTSYQNKEDPFDSEDRSYDLALQKVIEKVPGFIKGLQI